MWWTCGVTPSPSPSVEMRRAIAEAEVGDDVYMEDSTVNRLQERAAEIFGREAALFVPSGSMGNLIAIKIHTRPGNEVICEERGHVFNYEMGAMSAIAGTVPRPIHAEGGILRWEQVKRQIRPKVYSGISILSFTFTRKPMPLTLSCQSQIARASLRW